ncbi:alpha/beta-hydrolase [Bimuria novae-zelandiae CBS 107.79]|uniref:Alpha/beta-hydrolase n=1 Tax=Bimuria novae-zelandiae CBS 107.79 TaxID=1447943 RepID=A0A6A5UH11_9PLEO|nr:alpha/beta-hydrolase [Bimuria novae-zelandiae CBS 107.79]
MVSGPFDPFDACNRLFEVKLTSSPEQLTLYDNYVEVDLSFKQGAVRLLCYIPKAVSRGDVKAHDVAMLHFHGGGLVTGRPGFEPWRNSALGSIRLASQIIVEPYYRLMPEASGSMIVEDVIALLDVFRNGSVKQTLLREFPLMSPPDFKRLLCSATSSGAFLAFRFVLRADRLGILVSAVVLFSPMVETYTRLPGQHYGEYLLSEEQHKEIAIGIIKKTPGYRHLNHGSAPSGRTPPDRMCIYPITAVGIKMKFNGRPIAIRSLWGVICGTYSVFELGEAMLAQSHVECAGSGTGVVPLGMSPSIEVDCASLAKDLGKNGMQALNLLYSEEEDAFLQNTDEALPDIPSTWPPTFIAHGTADSNCPIEGVRRFTNLLEKMFPRVQLWRFELDGMPHAFDVAHPHKLESFAKLVRYHQDDSMWSTIGRDEIKLDGTVWLSEAARKE